MDSRVFAVIIGVDQYKSGDIWNLESCVDDAKAIKSWLVNKVGVPKHQIAMLLNERATKQNINDTLASHLLHNDHIQKGDAMLIYFAGHGSTLKWLDQLQGHSMRCSVEVLCPYDHDTKGAEGRVAGISARAMNAFLHDLSKAKGTNITLIIDSCFSSPPRDSRDRSCVRWTSTSKALVEDLYRGDQTYPNSKLQKRNETFYSRNWNTHTVITACKPGATAKEGMDGGRFTSAFLEIMHSAPLHSMGIHDLMNAIRRKMGESQHPQSSGTHFDRLFNAVPFSQDVRFVSVQFVTEKGIRIELGSQNGIEKGRELSIHAHNYAGSHNPSIATVTVNEVHPTYCLGRTKSATLLPQFCWARVPHYHILSYTRLKQAFHAILHSTALHKPVSISQHLPSPSISTSNIETPLGSKTDLIKPAEAILASKPLLPSLMK